SLLSSLKKNAIATYPLLENALPLSPERIRAIANLAEFDDVITAPLHGFPDAADYYQQCSGIKQQTKNRVPTQIIHA
ncbi:hydrolase, partial [Vibrio cholerae]